jgi:eukaryotic-like serine/threonine-protein kinase
MLTPGTRLGPYEILAPLGAGGMGVVYRARDARLDRDVAIKVIADPLAHDAEALRRFEREARSVAALSHPNIVALHDVGEADGVPFAVTELLEGESLRARLARGPLGWRQAAAIARAIADGLAFAHTREIVHRDLKPENVFLTNDGRVKILDFGLARTVRPAAAAADLPTFDGTLAGNMVGTIGYAAPEQVRGQPIGPTADIFSLGCVLYEMVTGRRARDSVDRRIRSPGAARAGTHCGALPREVGQRAVPVGSGFVDCARSVVVGFGRDHASATLTVVARTWAIAGRAAVRDG